MKRLGLSWVCLLTGECELPERPTPDQEGTSMDRGQSDLLKKLVSRLVSSSAPGCQP